VQLESLVGEAWHAKHGEHWRATVSLVLNLPNLNLIVLLPQVMKRFASKLLPGASSAKAVQKDEAHPHPILDNATTVFQQLSDLGSATFNILELQAAGKIGIQIVEICGVRPNDSSFLTGKVD